MMVGATACCAIVWASYGRDASGQAKAGGQQEGQAASAAKAKILFLHHSTGECVWNGGVKEWFAAYNKANKTEYEIIEQNFPKDDPYGWNNYPYDYWNIWVKHAGSKPFKGEPTLEMLTPKYDVIVFKHCFPVSGVEEDTGKGDVASEDKRIENYKLQYEALKKKLREFPKTKFIVWTGAALKKSETDEDSAKRAKAFFEWVRDRWDEQGDNIYIWDFRELETEGGLYLKDAYAQGDSHPNEKFSKKVAPLFCQRVLEVVRGSAVLELRILADAKEMRSDPKKLTRYVEALKNGGTRRLSGDETYQWFEIANPVDFFKPQGDLSTRFEKDKANYAMVAERVADKYYVLAHIGDKYGLTRRSGEADWSLESAQVDHDTMGRPIIAFTLDERGGNKLALLTRQNRERQLAILIDDLVISQATIKDEIHARGAIYGSFTPEEVNELVRKLNAGAQPKPPADKAQAP